jgi:hypothetical protein
MDMSFVQNRGRASEWGSQPEAGYQMEKGHVIKMCLSWTGYFARMANKSLFRYKTSRPI